MPALIRLGKQARDDGANWSDNVVGDVVEALIGAVFLDAGLDAAEALVRRLWQPLVEEQRRAPMHPKSALQELAAGKALGNPTYEAGRAQRRPPPAELHHPRDAFPTLGEAEGQGASKQEAETAAAIALLEKLK